VNVYEILNKIFNLLRRESKLKITGDNTMFYIRLHIFPEICKHF